MTTGMMTASTFMSPALFMGLKSKIISWPIDMRTGTMIALAFVERLPDLLVHLANESVAIQELEVLLHVPSLVHHAEVVVVGDVHQGVLHLLDERGGHVVARGLHVLLLGPREDVERHKLALGVPVLARLRRGDVDHLAGLALDDDVAALADGPGLHRNGVGRPRIRTLELSLLVTHRSPCLAGPG